MQNVTVKVMNPVSLVVLVLLAVSALVFTVVNERDKDPTGTRGAFIVGAGMDIMVTAFVVFW